MMETLDGGVLTSIVSSEECEKIPSEIAKKLGEKFGELLTSKALLETGRCNAEHNLNEVKEQYDTLKHDFDELSTAASQQISELETQLGNSLADSARLQATCSRLERETAEYRNEWNLAMDTLSKMIERFNAEIERTQSAVATFSKKLTAGHSTQSSTQSVAIQPWRSGNEPPLASVISLHPRRPLHPRTVTIHTAGGSSGTSTSSSVAQQQQTTTTTTTTSSSSLIAEGNSSTSSTSGGGASSSSSSTVTTRQQVAASMVAAAGSTTGGGGGGVKRLMETEATAGQMMTGASASRQSDHHADDGGGSTSSSTTSTKLQPQSKRSRLQQPSQTTQTTSCPAGGGGGGAATTTTSSTTTTPPLVTVVVVEAATAGGSVTAAATDDDTTTGAITGSGGRLLDVEYQVPTSSQRDHEEAESDEDEEAESDEDEEEEEQQPPPPVKRRKLPRKKKGDTQSLKLSPELASLVGRTSMPRHAAVKQIWAMIKERNLYDPENKRFAICDEALFKVRDDTHKQSAPQESSALGGEEQQSVDEMMLHGGPPPPPPPSLRCSLGGGNTPIGRGFYPRRSRRSRGGAGFPGSR